jgi:hypothetical protein
MVSRGQLAPSSPGAPTRWAARQPRQRCFLQRHTSRLVGQELRCHKQVAHPCCTVARTVPRKRMTRSVRRSASDQQLIGEIAAASLDRSTKPSTLTAAPIELAAPKASEFAAETITPLSLCTGFATCLYRTYRRHPQTRYSNPAMRSSI